MLIQRFALDRSTRRRDADGRLHVAVSNLSKANVCPYYGREIPNSEALGLKPDTVYQVYRDAEALSKAVETANNIPLMDDHIIVSASDPKKDRVVGSTGTDAAFDGQYLTNSLVVWDANAIARIESGVQKEISCAYRYTAIKRSGTANGSPYTLVMADIVMNHVALVREGRAGPDVMVADGKLGEVQMKFHPVKAKLAAKFATDSALTTDDRRYLYLALDEMEQEVEGEDEDMSEDDAEEKAKDKAKDAKAKDKAAKDKAAKDKKAMDKKAADAKKARDKAARDARRARDGDDDEDAMDSEMDDDAEEAEDAEACAARDRKAAKDKKAMDAAIGDAVTRAVKETEQRLEAIGVAKTEVAPIVGSVAGMDSAESIYRFALDAAHVDHKEIKEVAALRQLVKLVPRPGSQTEIAMDSKSRGGVIELFPSLARYS